MKFLRLAVAAAALMSLAALPAASALDPAAVEGRAFFQLAQAGQPAPVVVPSPGNAGTTVTTTAPVTADTRISIGTLAGQVLTWVVTAFAVPVGAFLVGILYKMLQGVGFSLQESARARLETLVRNGLALAAARTGKLIDGKFPVDLKSTVLADTVRYVQEHGQETLAKLGGGGGKVVEAIEARVEAALVNPAVPIATTGVVTRTS